MVGVVIKGLGESGFSKVIVGVVNIFLESTNVVLVGVVSIFSLGIFIGTTGVVSVFLESSISIVFVGALMINKFVVERVEGFVIVFFVLIL